MAERTDRGETAFSWLQRFVGLGAFVYALAELRRVDLAFLAIAVAAFPGREFRAFLKSWRRNGNGGNGNGGR